MIVVDSSIALQWVLPEEDASYAEELLGNPDLIAPDILLMEAANVLAKKVRAGNSTMDGALVGLRLIRDTVSRLVSSADLAAESLRLSVALAHPAYDCCFLACAVNANAVLATRDQPFIDRLRASGYGDRLHSWRGMQ
ncbi:MAG: PilT protein N-terminal [Devosia sp.]|uniref:type II toxin-antitoxin system VapC family toxin n=1 Tax=Devosia sp. TaxID=1871048 RepID=UPI002625D45B|nr:type II toxin-antitoxin system VapC family toxin [Devosia sp.]MDB5540729.1 PilT protein N-terminal [Devosia sp.]